MARLLDGIKVLEIANWVAAPATCAMMADLGADVIKVEHPETGDPVRSINVSTRGVVPYQGGVNLAFELLNRGKKSIGLNLESPQAQGVVHKLASQSDVLVTNLTPHRQTRYRLNYNEVSQANPRIIYVTLTGYGPEGPERDRSGFDYAAFWARSGIMGSLGEPESLPVQPRPGMGDQTTSLAMLASVGLALFERAVSGKGQLINCSLLNTGIWVLGADIMAALQERKPTAHVSRTAIGNPLHNCYQAGDGKWMQLVMVESERLWAGFCRALGLESIENAPRFETHARRTENSAELVHVLDDLFRTDTREAWGQKLDSQRCIWAPVQTTDEVVVDPQLQANGYLAKLDHPEAGAFEILNMPNQFTRTPGEIRSTAPELGQDTEALLLELGYSWEEIVAMKEQGATI